MEPQYQAPPKKRRRVFMWVFLAIQALFIIWIIAGSASATHNPTCNGLDQQTCQNAADAGATIAVGIIIFLWAAVDVIMGIVYLVVRANRR